MPENNVISFVEYLKKKKGKFSIENNFIETLGEEIKNRPELLEWYGFQNTFHKHKLFLHKLFTDNQRREGINPNAGYFASFTNDQIAENILKVKDALGWLARDYILIDGDNCTFRNMARQIFGVEAKSIHDAWVMFQDVLLNSNKVLIIANISKSKIASGKASYARSIIKINDDAHLKGKKHNQS
ncbi:MAG: hypothetical protein U9R57_14715 [Thermodesulfobacteriota bacterium]|nr:hypothetical protein [Thermodesulfobacteriota bacterium]